MPAMVVVLVVLRIHLEIHNGNTQPSSAAKVRGNYAEAIGPITMRSNPPLLPGFSNPPLSL